MTSTRVPRGKRLRRILPAVGLLVLPVLTPVTALADTDLDVGGTAVIAYANGDLVRLRSGASSGNDIIAEYPEGTTVTVLDGPIAADDGSLWYYVSLGGDEGYIVSDWLAASGGLLQSITGTAWTNDSVNLRTSPSTDADTIASLGSGTTVTLTGQTMNNWISVNVDGVDGWIYSAFLSQDGSTAAETSVAAADTSSVDWSGATGTSYTNDSVNLRAEPSLEGSVITELPAGATVSLTGAVSAGFVQASTDAGEGWIWQDYLSSEPVSTESESSTVDWSGPTGAWHTNDSVNLRTDANLDASVITELPAGANVTLTGAVANGFAQASTDSGDGWISQQYLSEGDAVTVQTQRANVSVTAAEVTEEPVAATSSQGQQMVDFAMQFLGQPYVWAGNTPGGFDCSGLTQYVVQNVLGYDIGHGTAGQTAYGTSVGWGEWQPGDLIFFQNTYEAGISHVGIYIGDGQMIHAENYSTGVTISDVYSDYYSSHYYGAFRLT